MVALGVVLVAAALVLAVYLGLERLGRAALVPGVLRFAAWTGLGLLLVDLSCARPPDTQRPVVLLDASLSMASAGGRWADARAEAARLGEVRAVGPIGNDSMPQGGHSALGSALIAAVASGRPVWVVSDGEIDDVQDIAPDLAARAGVKLFPRAGVADLALIRVGGPTRITTTDTLRLDVDVAGYAMPDRRQVTVDVESEGRRWFSGTVALGPGGSGTSVLEGTLPAGVRAGDHLITVSLREAGDGEPRTDRRLHALTVLPTPGIVVVAASAGWESRFLFRALTDVAALPVKGYFLLDANRWSRMGELTPVAAADVEAAVAGADLLVQFGDLPDRLRRPRLRARWTWAATSRLAATVEGDWYLLSSGASPVAGAFIGLPLDSFPPAVGLTSLTPSPGDWVGLSGQLNRRGGERPAVIGRDSAGRREVIVGAAGLWRWAFRGGASEQAYRAWVAATTSWLLGASDSLTGRARPVRAVVEQGTALAFERLRPDVSELPIRLRPAGEDERVDTLRFDGTGRASLSLPPGAYAYRLEGGGAGVLGVETYSRELLPRAVTLAEREPSADPLGRRAPIREQLWLFGLILVALSGEWWWRRRAGLR